jgi:hypothetical protein
MLRLIRRRRHAVSLCGWSAAVTSAASGSSFSVEAGSSNPAAMIGRAATGTTAPVVPTGTGSSFRSWNL